MHPLCVLCGTLSPQTVGTGVMLPHLPLLRAGTGRVAHNDGGVGILPATRIDGASRTARSPPPLQLACQSAAME